jgi:hypothetical protein
MPGASSRAPPVKLNAHAADAYPMDPDLPAGAPQMAREDRLAPRFAVPAALVLLAVLLAMTASERVASSVAAQLHLASASDVRAARQDARIARSQAAGSLGLSQALQEVHARQADLETQMSQFAADYEQRFHGPFPQDLLQDLDRQIQDVQGRLAGLEKRVAAVCSRSQRGC